MPLCSSTEVSNGIGSASISDDTRPLSFKGIAGLPWGSGFGASCGIGFAGVAGELGIGTSVAEKVQTHMEDFHYSVAGSGADESMQDNNCVASLVRVLDGFWLGAHGPADVDTISGDTSEDSNDEEEAVDPGLRPWLQLVLQSCRQRMFRGRATVLTPGGWVRRARYITRDDGDARIWVGVDMRSFANPWHQMVREFDVSSLVLLASGDG